MSYKPQKLYSYFSFNYMQNAIYECKLDLDIINFIRKSYLFSFAFNKHVFIRTEEEILQI